MDVLVVGGGGREHAMAWKLAQSPQVGEIFIAPGNAGDDALIQQIMTEVIQPAVDGMAQRGTPYAGVLYAGVMLTAAGPKVLEFNCRFGDPETQVILPMLHSDLAEIMLACAEGRLTANLVEVFPGAAATVVMASPGYPGAYPKGLPSTGLNDVPDDDTVFHAGTKQENGRIVTSGGRVLCVTALGDDMETAVQSTFGPEVLSDVGSFGGLYSAAALKEMKSPVLVAATDGVGTKTMVAAAMNRWHTIGQDIVNHSLNDILVQGVQPLFFLDYVASSKLEPEKIAAVVGGAAKACQEAGCALLGGETAEMPGVYQPGELDLVGTIVGVVDKARIVNGRAIQAGDVILGLPSSGLHTNGYTLARTVLAKLDWRQPYPDLDQTPGDALLTVHRSYLPELRQLWAAGIDIHGLAHITGGGLIDNPPRIFPGGLGAQLKQGSWPVPPIFHLIQQLGRLPDAEMRHVFNMGPGMLIIVPPAQAELAPKTVGNDIYQVGEMVEGENVVFTKHLLAEILYKQSKFCKHG